MCHEKGDHFHGQEVVVVDIELISRDLVAWRRSWTNWTLWLQYDRVPKGGGGERDESTICRIRKTVVIDVGVQYVGQIFRYIVHSAQCVACDRIRVIAVPQNPMEVI